VHGKNINSFAGLARKQMVKTGVRGQQADYQGHPHPFLPSPHFLRVKVRFKRETLVGIEPQTLSNRSQELPKELQVERKPNNKNGRESRLSPSPSPYPPLLDERNKTQEEFVYFWVFIHILVEK